MSNELLNQFAEIMRRIDEAEQIPDPRVMASEGAVPLNVKPHCRACSKPLTLEEMHYYVYDDGAATCNGCEGKWMEAMAAWRSGGEGEMPQRP